MLSSTTIPTDDGLCFFGIDLDNKTQLMKICHPDNPYLNQTSSSNGVYNEYGTAQDLDFMWLLICGAKIFFMQTGFTLLETGMVKASNVQNILFKNVMDVCIGTIIWFLFGYSIAFGDDEESNGFMGIGNVVLQNKAYNHFFFQWAFAATSATIVSGSVAERTTLHAYFAYTAWLTIWVYPITAHWLWSTTGFLSPYNIYGTQIIDGGIIDFAGAGVVHMVGGFSGLLGAIALGPRSLRFNKTGQSSKHLKHQFKFGHDVRYQVLGTMILWFGWYGFNPGSTLCANGCMELASKIAVNTTLSAAISGITVALITRGIEDMWLVPAICNGVLAGLVSITAACAVVDEWQSLVIGAVGGSLYYSFAMFLEYLHIDDPLEAFCVHGVAGFWGLISVGIFAYNKENILFAGYSQEVANLDQGYRFGIQLMAAVIIAIWTCLMSGTLFFIFKYCKILRISKDEEEMGLDTHEHGGKGYHYLRAYSVQKPKTDGDKICDIKGNIVERIHEDLSDLKEEDIDDGE